MSRSKQEVRDFLNTLVGLSVNAKSGIYQGQCVSLIKALMEFLGVPDPYKGRGDAKDAATNYVTEGIAKDGAGWLTVVVNKDMGNIGGIKYGHIWIDLKDEANFEQNGARALIATKDTRPFSQGQQYVNFDQWIGDGMSTVNVTCWRELAHGILGRNGLSGRTNALDGSSDDSDYVGRELDIHLINELFISEEAKTWRDSTEYASIPEIQARLNSIPPLQKENDALKEQVKKLQQQIDNGSGGGEYQKVLSAGDELFIKVKKK